jgi:hypothetical protein
MTIKKDQEFFVKYILPVVSSILTLVTVGQFYTTTITENELRKTSGKVITIIQDKYEHHKYTDDRIRIWLENSNNVFYFFDNRGSLFQNIKSNILVGDTLTISHRTYFQSLVGTGDEHKIMKIQRGDTVLYSFAQAKETFSSVGNFGTYVTIGIWIFYFLLIRKLKRQKEAHNISLLQ